MAEFPVQILQSIREMQKAAERFRKEGKKIAVVPTMGYLHNGHASLIERARSLSDIVITTIFVNPTQFGPQEDFQRYPRDFERDQIVAYNAGTDIIFSPEVGEMYPEGFNSFVEVEGVSSILEGMFRPKHFRGVTTVVTKLLHSTKPHIAVFGQKDAQQVFLIQKMIKDLDFDITIVLSPIIREADGLAMSSRNTYLNKTERENSLVLYRSLQHAKERIKEGDCSIAALRKEMFTIIQSGSPTKIDYIAFINPLNFVETEHLDMPNILVALAVWFGSTRLIDNILIPITF
jgi:pantoate--beta-alanine ligase